MKIDTESFVMPVDLYIKMWAQSLLRRNWWWLVGVLVAFAVLSYYTNDAIYVAVILGFAALPTLMLLLFFVRLSHPDTQMSLSERVAHVDDAGIVLRYTRGEQLYFPWEYVAGYKITRTYMMLYTTKSRTPLYLPFTAFREEKECVEIEKMVLQILAI